MLLSCYNALLSSHRYDYKKDSVSMVPERHELSLERRHLADRRARPTTLWSALRWQGRRTGFRRAGEGHQAYVDCLAWRSGGLAVLVYVCSLLDALCTLRHLQQGGQEANPLLALALAGGTSLFLHLKIGLTLEIHAKGLQE